MKPWEFQKQEQYSPRIRCWTDRDPAQSFVFGSQVNFE